MVFGKKKKIQSVTYINGTQPQQLAQIPDPQIQVNQMQESDICMICNNYKFYEDRAGVWHKCIRCK